MNQAPENNGAFSGPGMMRIMDDNFKRMFLCIMSLARRASGKAGWHRRSDTKPAATIAPCSITASQSYSRISRWRAATVAIRVSCAISAVPIF